MGVFRPFVLSVISIRLDLNLPQGSFLPAPFFVLYCLFLPVFGLTFIILSPLLAYYSCLTFKEVYLLVTLLFTIYTFN